MNQAVLGLTLTYAALAVLVLCLFLFTRLPSWIKYCTVFIITGFYFLTFYSLQGFLGWPTHQQLPENFQLLASSIHEPDETTGDKGHIHIWINSFIDNRPAPKPRAYELPYDLALHSTLENALKEQRKGKIQLGRVNKVDINDDEKPTDYTLYGQKRLNIEFYDLPDPELPEK